MAMHDDFVEIVVRIQKLIADPGEVLLHLFIEGDIRLHTGVGEK